MVNTRLQQDFIYAKKMGHPVSLLLHHNFSNSVQVKVRFYNFRCEMAEVAERKVDGFFGLLPGCEDTVSELVEGDAFVYPTAPTVIDSCFGLMVSNLFSSIVG